MALWTPLELGTTAFRLGLRAMDTDGLNAGAEYSGGTWSDWSGNGNHFAQATSGARPTYSSSITELGGLPGLVWDGSDDFLGCTVNYAAESLLTVFVVMHTGDYKGSIYEQGPGAFNEDFNFINFDRYFRSIVDTNATNQAEFLSEDFTNPHIYAAAMGDVLRAIYIDGATVASNTTSQTFTGSSGVTRLGMTLWDGEASSMAVGEYVVIAGTLLQADREKIEGYLAWKWGLQGNLNALHPFKSAAPTIGGGTNYTLTAAAKSIAITEQTANLAFSRAVAAATKTISVSRVAAGLLLDRRLTADTKAITVTKVAATLSRERKLTADTKAISIAKQDVSLKMARVLSTTVKAIPITGYAATFFSGKRLVADPKAINITKIDAALVYNRDKVLEAAFRTIPLVKYETGLYLLGPGEEIPSSRNNGGLKISNSISITRAPK